MKINIIELVNLLPEDIIAKIKEYVLNHNIKLEMFYQKHQIDEKKLQKILSKFTSKQLEDINWKYLYYKIYKTSPPRCDNDNLVSIFDKVENPTAINIFTDLEYEPLKLHNPIGVLYRYKLYCITRSDYYTDNVHTEKGRKRQQYKNIVDSWSYIHQGNKVSSTNPEIDKYFLNLEYELIRAIILLYPPHHRNHSHNMSRQKKK